MPGANEVTTVLGVSPAAKCCVAVTSVSPPACVLAGATVSVSPAASADAGSAASAAAVTTSPIRARLGRDDTWQLPPVETMSFSREASSPDSYHAGRVIEAWKGHGGRAEAMLAAVLKSCATVGTRENQ